MKITDYAKRIVKNEIKQNRFYIFVEGVAILVMILFTHMALQAPVLSHTTNYQLILASSLPYLLVVICCVMAILMVYYTNELYLIKHQHILGMLCVCGGDVKIIRRYLFAQNLMFLSIALPSPLVLAL